MQVHGKGYIYATWSKKTCIFTWQRATFSNIYNLSSEILQIERHLRPTRSKIRFTPTAFFFSTRTHQISSKSVEPFPIRKRVARLLARQARTLHRIFLLVLYVQRELVTVLYRESFFFFLLWLTVLCWMCFVPPTAQCNIVESWLQPNMVRSVPFGTDNLQSYPQDVWENSYKFRLVFITWSIFLVVCVGTKLGLES